MNDIMRDALMKRKGQGMGVTIILNEGPPLTKQEIQKTSDKAPASIAESEEGLATQYPAETAGQETAEGGLSEGSNGSEGDSYDPEISEQELMSLKEKKKPSLFERAQMMAAMKKK